MMAASGLSLVNPTFDFDVNAKGTLNVLEAARRSPHPPSLLFTTRRSHDEISAS
jgi:CDP-paratose 2-epimerase